MTFSSSTALRFLASTAAVIAFATPAQAQATNDYRYAAEWQTAPSPYAQDLPDAGLRPTIRVGVDANKNLMLVYANYPAISLTKQADGTFRGNYPGNEPVIVKWDSNYGLLIVDLFNRQWTRNYFSKNGIGSSVNLGLEVAKAGIVTRGRVVYGSITRTFLDLVDGTSIEFTLQDYASVITQMVQDPAIPDFAYTPVTADTNPLAGTDLAPLWDALLHRQLNFGLMLPEGVTINVSGVLYLLASYQYGSLSNAISTHPNQVIAPAPPQIPFFPPSGEPPIAKVYYPSPLPYIGPTPVGPSGL